MMAWKISCFFNSMYTNTIPEDREEATEGFVDVREEVVCRDGSRV